MRSGLVISSLVVWAFRHVCCTLSRANCIVGPRQGQNFLQQTQLIRTNNTSKLCFNQLKFFLRGLSHVPALLRKPQQFNACIDFTVNKFDVAHFCTLICQFVHRLPGHGESAG